MVIKPIKNKVTVSDKEINNRYKSLIESSPDGMMVVDLLQMVLILEAAPGRNLL